MWRKFGRQFFGEGALLQQRPRSAQLALAAPKGGGSDLYVRALERRSEVEYENGSGEHGAHLEQLAVELTHIVPGPEAERDLERARQAKRDAESLKIYANQQRQEVDGTVARVLVENVRAHIAHRL
jgi:hypothetical protein